MSFERKNIRLREFNYTGYYAYFITICTYDKKPVFKDGEFVQYLLSRLEEESAAHSFGIFAYCFMPDHLHLLLLGNEHSSLVKFIKSFKQKTGFYFKKKSGENLWQKSFYDHILRKSEDLKDTAVYIFNNPVRKGIVDNPRNYPYSGSFMLDAGELFS